MHNNAEEDEQLSMEMKLKKSQMRIEALERYLGLFLLYLTTPSNKTK